MPAAPMIVEAAAAIYGVVEGMDSQNQAGKAQQAAQANQNTAISDAIATAKNPVPYLNAEKGAAETLKSNIGGVANPGAQIQALYGNDLSAALNNSLQNTTSTELAAGGQYGLEATAAGKAQGTTNPLAAGVGSIASAFNPLTRTGQPAGNTGTTTGFGSGSSGAVAPPPDASGGAPVQVADLGYTPGPTSGFIPQTT